MKMTDIIDRISAKKGLILDGYGFIDQALTTCYVSFKVQASDMIGVFNFRVDNPNAGESNPTVHRASLVLRLGKEINGRHVTYLQDCLDTVSAEQWLPLSHDCPDAEGE